ncbi:MAG: hypothetical protein EP312_00135 [Gammaproteobacteria bacterium]|nr:MAG: hypothetical protein EP312_00135 [Gammaproteobacteria bacterium]
MDYAEMHEVAGSSGPALILRSVFNELNRGRDVRPLYFSDALIKRRVCIDDASSQGDCESRDEWFLSGMHPEVTHHDATIRLRKPSAGLMLAMDPRIPDEHEYFEFALMDNQSIVSVDWYVDGKPVGQTGSNKYQWKVSRGKHQVYAIVHLDGRIKPVITDIVDYVVH